MKYNRAPSPRASLRAACLACLLFLAFCLCIGPSHARTPVTVITDGQWQPLPLLDAAPGEALPITLPSTLPRSPRIQRLAFNLALPRPNQALALLIPSGANAIWVEWNSHLVAQGGSTERAFSAPYYSGDAHRPLRIDLPVALWQEQSQRLVITLSTDHLQPISMPPLYIGSASALEPLYRSARSAQVEAPWASAGALATLAALLIICALLTKEMPYQLAALTSVFASCHLALQWIPNPLAGSFGHVAWAVMYRMMLPLFMWAGISFWLKALDVADPLWRRIATVNLPLQLLVLTVSFSLGANVWLERASAVGNLCVSVMGIGVLSYKLLSKPTTARAGLLAFSAVLLMAILYGLTSVGLERIRAFLAPWLPYAMLTFCLIVAWELLERLRRALLASQVNSSYFARQLELKKRDLAQSFNALRDAASKDAVEAERKRIMREIHDGIGSSLVNAMSLVNTQQAEQKPLALALQDTMSELRMAIDALQPHEADLLTALGTLRSRVEPALRGAGIELRWEVEQVPEIPRLTPENTLHLYRFVQEAFANAIKHSQASVVTVRTDYDVKRDLISVMVDDNGKGWRPFQAGERRGGGSETLKQRALRLSGWARVMPLNPGTRVLLCFPRSEAVAEAVQAQQRDFVHSVPAEFSHSRPRSDFMPSRPPKQA